MEQHLGLAADWFAKAARQEYPRGQYWLGRCFQEGAGVKKDLQRARELYRLAAENGSQEAAEALKKLDGEKKGPLKSLLQFWKK